jgi:hypothetical protein
VKRLSMAAAPILILFSVQAQTVASGADNLRQQIDELSRRSGADTFRDHAKPPTQDTASVADRKARDEFWNARLPHPPPGVFPGAEILRDSEFAREKASAWLVASVEGYAMRSPRPHRGAYTEFQLRVSRVLTNDSAHFIETGSRIAVGEAGGTVVEDGQEHSYFLSEEGYPLLPSHRYLIEMRYREAGNFWLARAKWDLTSGTAVPDDDISLAFWSHGKSRVAGMEVEAAIDRAAGLLAQAVQSPGAPFMPSHLGHERGTHATCAGLKRVMPQHLAGLVLDLLPAVP